MKDPHWWLKIIRRGEKIVSCAFAVTMFWLFLWHEFWPEPEGRVQAIAYMIVLIFVGILLEGTAWIGKMYMQEVIDERKSDKDWKKIQEGRWPSG